MDYAPWDRVRASYDEVAGSYQDRFASELRDKPRDRELLDAFASTVDGLVVEIGCGPGHIGARVRTGGHRFGRHRVVGFDLSESMTALARQRLDAAAVADMRALPVATASAGGLLAFYSIIHVPRPDRDVVLREFARVVRPGGRALFSAHEGTGEIQVAEFVGHPVPMVATLYDLDELTDATRAGFNVTRAERRQPYPTESSTVRLYVEAVRT